MKRLESKGHTIAHFEIPNNEKIVEQLFEFILADNGAGAMNDWKDEILDKSIIVNRLTLKCPLWLRKVAFLIVEQFSPTTARGGLSACYPRCRFTTAKFWDSMSLRDERMAHVVQKMNSEEIDVILGPGMSYPGIKHNIYL